MRATVTVAAHKQSMPVHRGVFREAVGDGDLHVVAAVQPQGRPQIATVVPERTAALARKELRRALQDAQGERLALLARIQQRRDVQRAAVDGDSAPHGRPAGVSRRAEDRRARRGGEKVTSGLVHQSDPLLDSDATLSFNRMSLAS